MAIPYIRHKNITASGLVETGPGRLHGIMVNSHTSGTLKVWDSLTAANDVVFNTLTFAAGSGIYFPFTNGIVFSLGLFCTVGGTADITIMYAGIDR